MKLLFGLTALAISLSTASVFAAERVDFRAVNPVLQALLDAVVIGDKDVDYSQPRFDETFSSLKEEKLKYDMDGALKNVPWTDGGRATSQSSVSFVVERSPQKTGVAVSARTTTRTDVLALIRYAGYLAIKKAEIQNDEFSDRIYAHLHRASVVQSLDELEPLLTSANQLAHEMIEARIARHERNIRCLTDGSCGQGYSPQQIESERSYYRRKIAELRLVVEGIDQVKVESRKSSNRIAEITVSTDKMGLIFAEDRSLGDQKMRSGKARAVLTPETITASFDGFVDVEAKALDECRSTLEKRLSGVQEGETQAKQFTQDDFRTALIELKKAIHGKFNR